MEDHNEPLSDPQLPDGGEQNNPPSPTPAPPIQPTPSPAPPATDTALLDLMRETIREQNRTIGELQRSMTENARQPVVPERTPDQIRQEFFENPEAAQRRIVREELAATVGPLQEFVRNMQAGSKVDQLVAAYKQDARFAPHWSPALESYVREQAGTVQPDKLNEQTFSFLVTSALGLQVAGMIAGPARAPEPTPAPAPPAPPAIPPHFRPSAPPSPSMPPNNQPATRQLTENEKRLLREYNASKPAAMRMTEAQYVKWQEMDAGEVATTTFDRPAR